MRVTRAAATAAGSGKAATLGVGCAGGLQALICRAARRVGLVWTA